MDASLRQQNAANPKQSVWVGASAGTGKTKILVDRMLRLYLDGARIDKILCLTFTKAAAAEMQNRLLSVLQKWAVSDAATLFQYLKELTGLIPGEPQLDQARRLFFDVLDTEGGLKIQTIHGFCQGILERFPLEANIQPGFSLIDDVQQDTLIQNLTHQFLTQFPERGEDIDFILKNIGESTFSELLESIFQNRLKLQKIFYAFPDETSYAEHLKNHLVNFDITVDDVGNTAKDLLHYVGLSCDDPKIESLRQFILNGDFALVKSIALTADGNLRKSTFTKAFLKQFPIPETVIESFALSVYEYDQMMRLERVIGLTSAFMRIAKALLNEYAVQKYNQGLLDFDDLIEKTTTLLENQPMSAWVMYKLDGGIEHILLDEAQDTSVHQWQVILALIESLYFTPNHKRTLFVVGDVKQSIYSFQGASPQQFTHFWGYLGEGFQKYALPFSTITLEKSYRSTPAVLNLVDTLFNADKTGLEGDLSDMIRHIPHRHDHAGHVQSLPLVSETVDVDTPKRISSDPWHIPHEYTLSQTKRSYLADQIADHIQELLTSKIILPSTKKVVTPADVMILVKSRTEFIEHINRALRERQIPTSGADRFILNDELAIQDLLALARFTQLPEDDYNFACLLKSPLINDGKGLNEEELFNIAYNRTGTLWNAFRNAPQYNQDIEWFNSCKNKADYIDLPTFFQDVLNLKRPDFNARFGPECDDFFEAFMEHVCAYSRTAPTSMQGFLLHIEQTPLEIKRDTTDKSHNRVRIMTVHASKGLQAPIVYLADCNKGVDDRKERFVWADDYVILKPSRVDMPECITLNVEQQKQKAIDEDRRLLYVALTRAEDHLFVTGTARDGKTIENSWYDLVARHIPEEQCVLAPGIASEQKDDEPFKSIIEISPHFYSCPILKIKDPERPEKSPEQHRGIRIHQFFEYVVPHLHKTPQSLWDGLFYRFGKNCGLDEGDVEKCAAILNNPDYYFLWATKGYNEIGLNVDGVEMRLDRLIIIDNKAYILDYKSGKLTSSMMLRYNTQLDAYKNAVCNLFNIQEVDRFLLFVDVPELMKLN